MSDKESKQEEVNEVDGTLNQVGDRTSSRRAKKVRPTVHLLDKEASAVQCHVLLIQFLITGSRSKKKGNAMRF